MHCALVKIYHRQHFVVQQFGAMGTNQNAVSSMAAPTMADDQFRLYFQPIVHLRTGRIHKAGIRFESQSVFPAGETL